MLNRRSFLGGIASLPLVGTLVPETFKTVITKRIDAAWGDKTVATLVQQTPPTAGKIKWSIGFRKEFEPGLNAIFKEEWESLHNHEFEELSDGT